MSTYAVTNLQLFNQLLAQEYTQENLKCIQQAYEMARLLFSGRFIASGRSQLAHCVGTASILAFFDAPGLLVAAGLIHNVYQNGDFGDGGRGISEQRQTLLREALGPEIEQEVADFANVKWNEQTIKNFLFGKGPLTFNLVFLRLADTLEHNLEGGMFYNQKAMKAKRGLSKNIPPYVIHAANVLGRQGLTRELERVKMENDSLQPLDHLYKKFGRDGGFHVHPPSYTQKVLVTVRAYYFQCRREITKRRS